MINQLLNIIDEAFQEGVISEEKKQEIIKKGEKLGIDSFEVRMYIENHVPNKSKLKKCPVCSANISLLSKVCEFCGTNLETDNEEISQSEITKNIRDRIEIINSIEIKSYIKQLGKNIFIPAILAIIITLFLQINFNISNNDAIILVVIYGVLALPSMIFTVLKYKNIKTTLNSLKSDFYKYKNIYKLYYENDSTIQTLEKTFTNKYSELLSAQNKINIKAMSSLFIVFIILVSPLFSLYKTDEIKYLRDTNKISFDIINPDVSVESATINDLQFKDSVFTFLIFNTDYLFAVNDGYIKDVEIRLKFSTSNPNEIYGDSIIHTYSIKLFDENNQLLNENYTFKGLNPNELTYKAHGYVEIRYIQRFKELTELHYFLENIKKTSAIVVIIE